MGIKDKLNEASEKVRAKASDFSEAVKNDFTDKKEKLEDKKAAKDKEKAFRSKIEEIFSSAINNLGYYVKERNGDVKAVAEEIVIDMKQRIKSLKKLDLNAFKIDCENISFIASDENKKYSSKDNEAERKLENSELDKVYKISRKAYDEVMEIVEDYFKD